MSMNKLLVAVDGSEGSNRALEMALSIARPAPDTHVDLVYVVPVPPLSSDQERTFMAIQQAMVQNGEEILREAEEKLGPILDRVRSKVLVGSSPADEIIKLVNGEGYDLVVIGCRGLSGIKAYLGSVSHQVLNGSKTSVLIAK